MPRRRIIVALLALALALPSAASRRAPATSSTRTRSATSRPRTTARTAAPRRTTAASATSRRSRATATADDTPTTPPEEPGDRGAAPEEPADERRGRCPTRGRTRGCSRSVGVLFVLVGVGLRLRTIDPDACTEAHPPHRLRRDETAALGAEAARELRAGDVVVLHGEVGAGKTTFVRGAARALGITRPVTSPTFTIGRRYEESRAAARARRPPPRRLARRGGAGAARRLPQRRPPRVRRVARGGGRRADAAAAGAPRARGRRPPPGRAGVGGVNLLAFDTATPGDGRRLVGEGVRSELRHDPAPGERPQHAAQVLAARRRGSSTRPASPSPTSTASPSAPAPGRSPGLRIGVATARALAQGDGRRARPASRRSARSQRDGPLRRRAARRPVPVLAVLDARRGEAFVAGWRGEEQLVRPAAVTPALLGRIAAPRRLAGRGGRGGTISGQCWNRAGRPSPRTARRSTASAR